MDDKNKKNILSEFTEQQRSDAMLRFSIIQPHIDDGISLAVVAHETGVPIRTIQRWLANYRDNGLIGLIRSKRSDCGHRKIPQKIVQLIKGMALQKNGLSIASIHRHIVAMSKEESLIAPSYSSVYSIIKSI